MLISPKMRTSPHSLSAQHSLTTSRVKECHGKGQKETMRALSNEFSSHRKVGESEAYYKLFPELHLTESSRKTVYFDTNFPSDRNVFLRKMKPKGKEESDEEEDS